MIRKWHYNRNKNQVLLKTLKEAINDGFKPYQGGNEKHDNFHEFRNPDADKYVKRVGKHASMELVYDGKGNIILDPADLGTYNFYDGDEFPFRHSIFDILPWLIWGNAKDDPTTFKERWTRFITNNKHEE